VVGCECALELCSCLIEFEGLVCEFLVEGYWFGVNFV